MKYFFILGNNPTLSIAELSTVFELNTSGKAVYKFPQANAFLLATSHEFNATQLIKKLGGTIKIGKIKVEIFKKDQANILSKIKNSIKPTEGKFKFGISYYGKSKFNKKNLAMKIKKYLRDQNIASRWVTSREPTLSSVVVVQNKLIDKGREFIIIEDDKKLLIGQTQVVQPFKELSFRDYGRPARDDYAGMLPPKLAQIMINLSGAKTQDIILDPFCGSGTILTESQLLGFNNLIGSDLSAKAINDTKKNIAWIKSKFQVPNFKVRLYSYDITGLSKSIKPKSIDAIITEPYLGPTRGKFNVDKITKELNMLYSKSLNEFKKLLKPKGKIVMIWPVFYKTHRVSPDLSGFKIINPIPKFLQQNNFIQLTDRNTIIYGRPAQKVWREIVVLTQDK